MTPRTLFLIQLIDKLGIPLMRAINNEQGDKNTAETLAGLLSSSVKLGLSLTNKMGLHEEDGDMDSVRVALSASAAQMIADYYALHKKIPIDAEHDQLSKAVDALISFGENFTASKDHTGRLRNLGDDQPLFDAAQSQIFYLSAMQPVLGAVSAFSFGQSETRLLQDIAEKLQIRAQSLREALGGTGADDGEARFTELMILHALARLYTDIHRLKTQELEQAGPEGQNISIEDVWTQFDHQIAMLETLLGVALPQTQDTMPGLTSATSLPPQAEETAPPQTPEIPPVPAQPPASPPEEAPQAQFANPMGFFAQKPEQASPPAPETPAAQQTPQPVPAQAAESQGNPANPMSFFKPGAQSDDE